ncbi:MAG: YdbH domain-containing protein [Halioglobus sp.]
MTASRILAIILFIFLLGLAGGGYYYYRQLPEIIETQIRNELQEYGVQTFRYDGLKISRQTLVGKELFLSGNYAGMDYTAHLGTLHIHYNWRALLIGNIESVALNKLELTITEVPGTVSSESDSAIRSGDLALRSLLDNLPVTEATVEQWHLDYTAIDNNRLLASGKLSVTQQLALTMDAQYLGLDISAVLNTLGERALPQLQLAVDEAGANALTLELAVSAVANKQLQWDINATIDHHRLLVSAQRLQRSGIAGLDFLPLDAISASGQTNFSGTVQHPNDTAIAYDAIDDILAKLELELAISSDMAKINIPQWVINMSGRFEGQLSLSQGNGKAILNPDQLLLKLPTTALALPAEAQSWLRWSDDVEVKWADGATVIFAFDEIGNWSAVAKEARLSLGSEDSDFRLSQISLQLTGRLNEPDNYTTVFSGRLDGKLQRKNLPQFKLQLDQNGELSNSSLTLAAQDTAQSMFLSVNGQGDLLAGSGDIQASLGSEDLAYASESLLPLLISLSVLDKRFPLDLGSGRAQLDSQFKTVNFELAGLPRSELKAENISGIYDEYRFDGLAIDTAWSGIDSPQTLRPIDIKLSALDVGFGLSNIQLLLGLPGTAVNQDLLININAFTSEAFGGTLYLPQPAQWDMGKGSNQFTLNAESLNLADLVALQQGQDIQARGTLEGQLPVTISNGRFMIANGYLRALAPGGQIRYIANESSMALAESSKELAMALDLLNDFQFEVLSTEVELDEQGNLKLGLSLAGSNPSMFDGRAINFNINLEQNLDPLLQSLRLSDKLVEKLHDRIN